MLRRASFLPIAVRVVARIGGDRLAFGWSSSTCQVDEHDSWVRRSCARRRVRRGSFSRVVRLRPRLNGFETHASAPDRPPSRRRRARRTAPTLGVLGGRWGGIEKDTDYRCTKRIRTLAANVTTYIQRSCRLSDPFSPSLSPKPGHGALSLFPGGRGVRLGPPRRAARRSRTCGAATQERSRALRRWRNNMRWGDRNSCHVHRPRPSTGTTSHQTEPAGRPARTATTGSGGLQPAARAQPRVAHAGPCRVQP